MEISRNCMLYILNTRRALRIADASTGVQSLGASANHPSVARSRTTRGTWVPGGPVELASLGGVQVHTQVDTGDNHDFGYDSKKSRQLDQESSY